MTAPVTKPGIVFIRAICFRCCAARKRKARSAVAVSSRVSAANSLRDPKHWNRWLILAANDHYWWGDAPQLLEQNREKIRRVFLFTGEDDQVAENTKRAAEMLKDAHIRVRVKIVPGLGHEVPADRMITNYRRPLRWLVAAL